MLKFQITLALSLALIKLIQSALAQNDDINQLFCHLNQYAIIRATNNLDVFPCRK